MGVTIGGDAAKSGKVTNLLVIMRVRLSQKTILKNLTYLSTKTLKLHTEKKSHKIDLRAIGFLKYACIETLACLTNQVG